MSESDIVKNETPNPDDVLAAIQSFNDPSIIVNIFQEMGWNYSLEIRETLAMVKQNANLSIKFKALKHLRELLREAAEASGYIANVSQTTPNSQGGSTTFSARRIAGILNPVKKIESIEIKEPQNDRIPKTQTEPNRESNRTESQRPERGKEIQSRIRGGADPSEFSRNTGQANTGGTDTLDHFPPERDSGRADTERDVVPGGTEPPDGGSTSEQHPRAEDNTPEERSENPCIQTKPPTCDPKLFPGISSSAEDEK